MNKRTQELAKQFATDLLNRSGYDMREYEPFLEEAEKFVESLIRECVLHLHRRGVEGFDILEERNLKEHFGVKQ